MIKHVGKSLYVFPFRNLQAEISLCRVYKRPGVEDHPSLPRSLPTTRASSSRKQHAAETSTHAAAEKPIFQAFGGSNPQALEEGGEKISETSASSSTEIGMSSLGFPKHMNPYMNALPSIPSPIAPPPLTPMEGCSNILVPQNTISQVDDLQRLISFHQQASMSAQQQQEFYHLYHHPSNFPTMFQPQAPLNNSDRLWEWNPITEGNKDYFSPPFK